MPPVHPVSLCRAPPFNATVAIWGINYAGRILALGAKIHNLTRANVQIFGAASGQRHLTQKMH
jgi:hypothetical protein